MNNVVLIGRVTRDIDLRFIPSTGLAVAKFNLAVDRGLYGDKKQEAAAQGKQTADFIGITVFGKQAENCANYLAKGSQCAISGRISTGSYTTQTGEKRYTTEVVADRVEFLGNVGQAAKKVNDDRNEDAFYQSHGEDDFFIPVDDEDIPF